MLHLLYRIERGISLMDEYKEANEKERDDEKTIPAGVPTIHGKTYMCAYCHELCKPGADQLPTCPKCGWDRWIK